MSSAEDPPRLERRLGSALGWLYITRYSGKLLVFLSVVILARLLSPDDFALVAIALALIVMVDTLEVGVGSALIYFDRAEAEASASTAFTLHLLVNAVAAAVFVATAPLIADLYDDQRLVWVMRLLALNLVLRALGQTHENLLKRDLEFRKRLVPELGSGMSKGVASVALAFGGAGVWALVVGQLIGSAVRSALLWMKVPFRPRFDLGRGGRARRLLAYGLPLLIHAIIGTAALNADYLIIGSAVGVTALGFYVIAQRIPQLIFQDAFAQIHHALFPFYSRSREAGEDTEGRYFVTVRLVSLLLVPFLVPLTILAGPAIAVVFGPQWEASAPILPGLALGGALIAMCGLSGDLFKAAGRQGVLPWLTVGYAVVWIPTLLLIAPYGTVTVAWTWAGACLAWGLSYWLIARRVLGISLAFHLRAVTPAVIAGAGASAAAWLALVTLPETAALFLGTAGAGVVWAVLAMATAPQARAPARMLRRRLAPGIT